MSALRILSICLIIVIWLAILMLWMIGLGYGGGPFRLPSPFQDRLNDVIIFYVPLISIAWLGSKPLRQKLRNNASNQ